MARPGLPRLSGATLQMRDASSAELAPRPSAQAWRVTNGSLQGPQRWHRKKDARKKAAAEGRCRRTHSAPSSPPVRVPAHACAHAWRARTPPSREPPFHPGNRGSAAARARVGRGRAGSLRDGTGLATAEIAALKGSFDSSLSSGDWFGLEGLASSHGLAESKRWAQLRAERVGGARGPATEGEARPGTHPTRSDRTRPDLTEPERPQRAVAAPGTLADLCPAFGSGRVLRGGNREPHPGPRRPLRALGPFLPAARGVLRGWVPPWLE